MISLIAVVGRGGAIGPHGALPEFENPEVQAMLAARARQMTEGGVIVIGSNTARMMTDAGVRLDLMGGHSHHAIWSRSHGIEPEAFLVNLSATGRHVFICGGKTTFKVFSRFCGNFFIWRAELTSSPDNLLDPILPNWQERVLAPPMRMQ